MQTIIGRVLEREILMKHFASRKSEFVAVFGRRRVGKTFLVKSLFEPMFTFYATGAQNGDTARQLANFNEEIANFGGNALPPAQSWHEAFENLNNLVATSPRKEKKVLFLDEISWMGAASDFMAALDHFWNRWMSSRDDVLLIVCGSATSWIIDNIVKNTGGLHNRLTGQIFLAPFTLKECEEYCRENRISLPRYQILESYMIFGGIPYYLDFMMPGRSLYQNVDAMYFKSGAPLQDEYRNLFHALFKNAENYMKVTFALAGKRKGLLRDEIAKTAALKSGGNLTKILSDLVWCGFVREYLAFGKRKRDKLYQLVDAFTLFHLTFGEKQKLYTEDFWLHFSTTPAHAAWSGFAFERVCLLHVPQIKRKLGVAGVLTEVSSWRSKTAEPGAQIDLVIDRADKVINLCEIKFASDVYMISKEYSKRLREKRTAFLSETGTRKAVHTTMVTTYGVAKNEYGMEILSEVTMDDLFE